MDEDPVVTAICAGCGSAAHPTLRAMSAGTASCATCGRGFGAALQRAGLPLDTARTLAAQESPRPVHSEHSEPPRRPRSSV